MRLTSVSKFHIIHCVLAVTERTVSKWAPISQSDKDRLPRVVLRASESIRNLGVVTNHAQLTSDAHAPCLLDRRVRLIRRFIDDRALRLLVHAFITSRLDYCNGLCELHCGCLSTNTANSEQCCSFSLFRTSLQPSCTAAIPITLAAGCQLHNIQTILYFDV